MAGTDPANKQLFAGTVPANKFLLAGTFKNIKFQKMSTPLKVPCTQTFPDFLPEVEGNQLILPLFVFKKAINDKISWVMLGQH